MTLDDLRAYGAAADEGLARCMNNEAFYLKMVGLGLQDERFGILGDVLAGGEIPAAFEMAHALKGVIANLSLTPIEKPLSEMTEILRAGGREGCEALWTQVLEERQRLLDLG